MPDDHHIADLCPAVIEPPSLHDGFQGGDPAGHFNHSRSDYIAADIHPAVNEGPPNDRHFGDSQLAGIGLYQLLSQLIRVFPFTSTSPINCSVIFPSGRMVWVSSIRGCKRIEIQNVSGAQRQLRLRPRGHLGGCPGGCSRASQQNGK